MKPEKAVFDVLPVNENLLYANWGYIEDAVEPVRSTSVILAACTTAQASLEIYNYIEKFTAARVLYMDTDTTKPRYNIWRVKSTQRTRFFCAMRSSMQSVYRILISSSISRRTAWTSLDFLAICSPMTRCITHMRRFTSTVPARRASAKSYYT